MTSMIAVVTRSGLRTKPGSRPPGEESEHEVPEDEGPAHEAAGAPEPEMVPTGPGEQTEAASEERSVAPSRDENDRDPAATEVADGTPERAPEADGAPEGNRSPADVAGTSDPNTTDEEVDPGPAEAEGPQPLWSGDRMREAQERDPDVSRVAAWVQEKRKPDPVEMDSEGQDVRAMVARWNELSFRNGVLYRKAGTVHRQSFPWNSG